MKDFRTIVGALVLCAAVTGGIYFYRNSVRTHEEQAHVALSETLYQLDKAFHQQTTWSDVALAAQTGYQRFQNTSLAPYFLLVKAEAEVHEGASQDALNDMQLVVNKISKSSLLHDPLVLKEARLLLESSNEAGAAQGLKKLEKLADDGGPVADAALYYIGSYYAGHSDTTHAHEAWKKLVEKFSSQQPAEMSPWAQRAQAHLQQHNG